MKVATAMTRDVIWVRPEDSLDEVYRLMNIYHIRHFPVIEGSELVGILSRGDVLLQAVPDAKKAFIPDLTVRDAMTPSPITCQEDASVGAIASIMIKEKIDCLPVMKGGRLVGLVTSTDFLSLLTVKDTVEVRSLLPKKLSIKNWREIKAISSIPCRLASAYS